MLNNLSNCSICPIFYTCHNEFVHDEKNIIHHHVCRSVKETTLSYPRHTEQLSCHQHQQHSSAVLNFQSAKLNLKESILYFGKDLLSPLLVYSWTSAEEKQNKQLDCGKISLAHEKKKKLKKEDLQVKLFWETHDGSLLSTYCTVLQGMVWYLGNYFITKGVK